MSVRVITSTRLDANLERMNRLLRNSFKKASVTTALKHIETPAKKSAPVDTGRLRASIHTKYTNKNDVGFMYKDKQQYMFNGALEAQTKDTPTLFTVVVGTNVIYSIFQEAKHNYLKNAFLTSREKFKDELKKEFDKAVNKILRR